VPPETLAIIHLDKCPIMTDRMRADRAGDPWREFGLDASMAVTTRKCRTVTTVAGKTAG
jgi:hypothetical protein